MTRRDRTALRRAVRCRRGELKIAWSPDADTVRVRQDILPVRERQAGIVQLSLEIRAVDIRSLTSRIARVVLARRDLPLERGMVARFQPAPMRTGTALRFSAQASAEALQAAGIELIISFKPSLGEVVIGGVSLRAAAATDVMASGAEQTAFGRIDVAESHRIIGWVGAEPGSPDPCVEIMVDDTHFATLRADTPRPDLLRRDISGRQFSTRLLLRPHPERPAVVESRLDRRPIPGRCEIADLPHRARDWRALAAMRSLQAARQAAVTIVIPVFNAADALADCLDSVLRWTSLPACDLLVVDDASTDPAVEAVLAAMRSLPNVRVMRNATNLGFSGTVNAAIMTAGRRDVVLLNSDTRVTPRWLENLRLAAHGDAAIASATAVSDNAGPFSLDLDWAALAGWEGAQLGRLVAQASGLLWPEIPTNHGFCTYLRRDAIDAVGLFDAAAFPRGYGEENDWSMRAGYAGWRHVLDDRTLVFHRRAASFGEERRALGKAAKRIVDERYPEYAGRVAGLRSSPAFLTLKHRVRHAARLGDEAGRRPRPRILYVISSEIGGTPQTNADLMAAIGAEFEPLLLKCDRRRMQLFAVDGLRQTLLASHDLAIPIEAPTHRAAEYDGVVTGWLVTHAIDLVHVRHIAWHSLGLFDAARDLAIPILLSCHDYYMSCPTVKLIDDRQRFCGGACTAGDGYCVPMLWPRETVPKLKHAWVHNWRRMMAPALARCDAVVTTDPGLFEVMADLLPPAGRCPRHIVPHGRDFASFRSLARPIEPGQRLRIGLPGNINVGKGAALVAEIKRMDRSDLLEFHVFGKADALLDDTELVRHGSYEREDLGDLLAAADLHIGAVLSIWPETFCHTLTELWANGLPVLGIDLGAVGARLRETGAGWLVGEPDAAAIHARLAALARSRDDQQAAIAKVLEWQRTTGTTETTHKMAAGYAAIYRAVLARRRVFAAT